MKKIYLKFIFCFLIFSKFHTQVLTVDRENGQDTIPKKALFTWTTGLSLDKQRNNLIEIESAEELDIFLPKNNLIILLGNTAIQINGKSVIENNGYFMFRLRDNDSRRISPDYFAQYQWNGVLGMQNRALVGVNSRFKFWEEKRSDLYFSTGLFYEYEKWNPDISNFGFDSTVSEVTRNLIRWNNSIKMALKIADNIDFATSNFIQFPLNAGTANIFNPRWFMNASLFFKINKHLNFICNYEHNLDFYRALPIDTYYYSLNFQVQVNY